MKKLLFTLVLTFMSLSLFSQENNTQNDSLDIFCQIVGTSNFTGTKVKIAIDFGQEQKFIKSAKDYYMMDESTGKPKVFNSMVDALNYMGSMGWNFEQAYVITMGNQNVYHFLLSQKIEK